MRILIRLAALVLMAFVVLMGLLGCLQRRLLYFPSHADVTATAAETGLRPWQIDGEYTGYARTVPNPRKIWFVTHGNAGQAGNRGYIVACLDATDSVYVLEYPGFGGRTGSPSKAAFDAAALKAYLWLVKTCGVERLTVLGESIGSGPASMLAHAPTPPRHIVLVVPFDVLTDVAQEKYRFLPVGLIMLDRWDNIAALAGYPGRLDIFGGTYDPVIPVHHARKLAAAIPGAIYHEFPGGHNWAEYHEVDLSHL